MLLSFSPAPDLLCAWCRLCGWLGPVVSAGPPSPATLLLGLAGLAARGLNGGRRA